MKARGSQFFDSLNIDTFLIFVSIINRKIMKKRTFLILVTTIVGMCSIIYELLISTASSYFLGNSVKQFSLIIGFYMAAMGLGAYLAKFFKKDLLYRFIQIELWLGLVGAFSVPLCYLYFLFADYQGYNLFVFLLITVIGTLTGLEVPLLTRILEKDDSLRNNISNILAFDYLGALIATIAFPFFLIPFVGIYKSSLIFGLINIFVGAASLVVFREHIEQYARRSRLLFSIIISVGLIVVFCLITSNQIMQRWSNGIFKHPVVYSAQSPYQDITITKNNEETRLYLNGAIQFSSKDEYRYHEALVHIPMMQLDAPRNVLLLGGGEGLAAREVLKYDVHGVDLVDIDPAITSLGQENATFKALNQQSLSDPKIKIHHQDAFKFLIESKETYEVIIADLPDPTSENLARLYSHAFYKLVLSRLSPNGVFVTQATSSTLTPQAFWCIDKTLREAGFSFTYPYQINVPSFGNWGFILASMPSRSLKYDETISTRFLESEIMNHLFYIPKDQRDMEVLPNFLDSPILMEYYLNHWRELNHESK